MLIMNVKPKSITSVATNWKAQATFYVDDQFKKGLQVCKFARVESGKAGGLDAPVMTYAQHKADTHTDLSEEPIAIKAGKTIGMIYESSPKDRYGRKDDFNDERRLFPKGVRTWKKYAPMPSGVLQIIDESDTLNTGGGDYFRALDKTILVDSIVEFDDVNETVTLEGLVRDIRLEETVEIDGDEFFVIDIEESAGNTILTLDGSPGDITKEVTFKCQFGREGYLADSMAGDYAVPFTMIPVDEDGNQRQTVGRATSGITFDWKV